MKFQTLMNPSEPDTETIHSTFDILALMSDRESPSSPQTRKPRPFLFCIISFIYSISMLLLVFDIISLSSVIPSDYISLRGTPPAKRAVVFIADGTKADSIFGFNSSGMPTAPFLRNIIQTKGSFGVSYAGLPTETRSCVTVLLAGHFLEFQEIFELYFYEKTSTDHILNESNWAWSFGSPEIIHIYQSSKKPPNIEIEPYDNLNMSNKYAESQRVFEQFYDLFERAKEDKDLAHRLRQQRNTISVHLVGVDTSGHTKGAQDPDYFDQITFIDQGIEKAVKIIEEFFGDKDTVYLLSSDHGMKDTFSHFGDNIENIRIPFIAWGAGITGPEPEEKFGETHDEYSRPWKLEGIKRKDVLQSDLAITVASLIGIPVPVNSEGRMPIDYLQTNHMKAEAGLLNSRQICSQYRNREKAWHKDSYTAMFFDYASEKAISRISEVENHIANSEYKKAIELNNELIHKCEGGIKDLKQTGRNGYIAIMVFGCASWLAYCIRELFTTGSVDKTNQPIYKMLWAVSSGALLIYLILRNSPWHAYLYIVLPLFFSYKAWLSSNEILNSLKCRLVKIFWTVIFVGVLDSLAIIFQRKKPYLLLVFVAWSVLAVIQYRLSKKNLVLWATATTLMAYFLTYNYIDTRNYLWLTTGWVFLVGLNIAGLNYFGKRSETKLMALILGYTVLAGPIVALSDFSIRARDSIGSSFYNFFNLLSIPMAFGFPLLVRFCYKSEIMIQFYILFASMGPYFLIESYSFEVFFYCLFGIYLYIWLSQESPYGYDNGTLTRAAIFMIGFQILYQVGYVGFGNTVTLDSFILDVGFRLVDKFSPIRMGIFLILKFAIPFILLSYVFQRMAKMLFSEISPWMVHVTALAFAGVEVLAMIWPQTVDYKHPKLSLSYPIMAVGIYMLNIVLSLWGNVITKHE